MPKKKGKIRPEEETSINNIQKIIVTMMPKKRIEQIDVERFLFYYNNIHREVSTYHYDFWLDFHIVIKCDNYNIIVNDCCIIIID
jgi:hypothetical protein